MRRIAVIAALALGALFVLPVGAGAGGVEQFEFQRPYYSPGDSALGRTRVWFESEEKARRATMGRFAAYLLPEGRWLRPPGVPRAAIPLGPVTFSSPQENTAVATLDFTVPEVSNGDWSINVCGQPCTHSMIGNLIGGELRVAGSQAVAAVMGLEDRLELLRETARRDSRRAERQLHLLRVQFDALRTKVKLLEGRLERQGGLSRNEPAPAASFPAPVGWVLVALTVLFGLVAFRPRKRPVLAPDPPAIERIEQAEREPVG